MSFEEIFYQVYLFLSKGLMRTLVRFQSLFMILHLENQVWAVCQREF